MRQIASTLKITSLFGCILFAAILPLHAEPAWTQPAPLNSYATEDRGSDETFPSIATDGSGNYMALWSYLQESHLSYLETSYSGDGGATWSDPVAIDGTSFVQFYKAAIEYAGDGTWLAMWLASVQIGGDWKNALIASTTTTGTQVWTEPSVVQILDNYAERIDIDSSSSGTVIATIGSHIFRSTDYGQSWSSIPTDVYVFSFFDNAIISHAGGDKWLHLVSGHSVSQHNVKRVVSAVSTDNGRTWENEQEHHPLYSVLDAAASNNVMVAVTYDPYEPGPNLYLRVSEDSGNTWTTTTLTHSAAFPSQGYFTRACLNVDQAGNWVLISDAPSNTQDDTDKDLIIARSTDPATGWSAFRMVAAEPTANERAPAMASDDAGNLLLAYQVQVENASVHTPDSDIKATKSTDAGATWSTPKYLNNNALTDLPYIGDGNADVAYGDNGTVVASWNANNLVMFARSDDYGQTWSNTAPATLVKAFGAPHIYYRGNGNWFIWYPTQGNSKSIISTDNGFTWSDPVNFYGSLATGSGPDNGTMIKSLLLSSWPVQYSLARLDRSAQYWDEPVIIADHPKAIVHSGGNSWFVRTGSNFIWTSEDDGRTWTQETSANLPPPYATHASNHAGVVIAAWDAFNTAIYARTSTDNGRTWSQTKLVFENDFDLVERKPVKLTYTGYNKWLLLWTATTGPASSEPQSIPEVRIIKASTSQDNGATWSAASEVPTSWMDSWDYSDLNYDYLDVLDVAASRGQAIVIWERRLDLFDADREELMLYGADQDLFYNYSQVSPPPTAARDWQLFE